MQVNELGVVPIYESGVCEPGGGGLSNALVRDIDIFQEYSFDRMVTRYRFSVRSAKFKHLRASCLEYKKFAFFMEVPDEASAETKEYVERMASMIGRVLKEAENAD